VIVTRDSDAGALFHRIAPHDSSERRFLAVQPDLGASATSSAPFG
jgi:hypothetical protein